MTPTEIFNQVSTFSRAPYTTICNLHSACSPQKRRSFSCRMPGSKTPVIDFDQVKTKVDTETGDFQRKSVDALTVNPSQTYLCFVELKSWELQISYHGSEDKIRQQANKYSSDLPQKLTDSIQICKEISKDAEAFTNCKTVYILVTDISVEDNALMALTTDLAALAGTSSKLKKLCNTLSKTIMDSIPASTNRDTPANIPTVETRYWECRNFDKNLSQL